jgi:hypothetical protein
MEQRYFQIIAQVDTQAKKDLMNHFATKMDPDSYWNTHDYTEESWRKSDDDTHWFMDAPAGDNGKVVVQAWLNNDNYSAPIFDIFRNAHGDGLSFRAGISEADFNTLKGFLEVEVLQDMESLLTARGIVEDDPNGIGG